MAGNELIVSIVFIAVTGGVASEWIKYRTKLAQMRWKGNREAESVLQTSLQALREEIRALRDTTTQYDLSFDMALQRLEGRVERLEIRANAAESTDVELRNVR